MNNTMTRRIFRSTLLVGVVVLLAALALVLGVLYSYFGRVQESQLRDELSLAAVGVTQSGEDYLRQLKSDQYRITWVAADGSVLFDTQADASAMENHAQRQEIQQALAFLRTMDLRAVGQRTIERLFHALEMRYDFQLGAASCGEREENT